MTAIETKILSYNPNDYRSRTFGLDFLNVLIKNKISQRIERISKSKHLIMTEDYDKANELLQQFFQKKNQQAITFKKGIKINFDKFGFKVDFFYNKVSRLFPGHLYLPEGWKGGKSIQNHQQSDFYTFNNVTISDSKGLNGRKILVTMLSKKSVWILPNDFQQRTNGLIEDWKMANEFGEKNFESLLSELSEKEFKGEEWNNLIEEKKIFYTHKN